MNHTQVILDQIDAVLAAIDVRQGSRGELYVHGSDVVRAQARARLSAAIMRLAPPGSALRIQADEINLTAHHDGYKAIRLVGVLRALRDEYEAGFLHTVEELVHGDVFADFLEMSDELAAKKYKDAAAVIAGSVLEEHLRKLAQRSNVPVETADGKPRKADTINAELVKAGTYDKLEQKAVTAWLGLRNEAAHGHYENYGLDQVLALIRDVRSFMIRHRA
jgi:hypothetical protein